MSFINWWRKQIKQDKLCEEALLDQSEPEHKPKLYKAALNIQFTDGNRVEFWSSNVEYCEDPNELYWKGFLDWYKKGKSGSYYMHTEADKSINLILRKNIYSFQTYFKEM
jgi:hypothetical protein